MTPVRSSHPRPGPACARLCPAERADKYLRYASLKQAIQDCFNNRCDRHSSAPRGSMIGSPNNAGARSDLASVEDGSGYTPPPLRLKRKATAADSELSRPLRLHRCDNPSEGATVHCIRSRAARNGRWAATRRSTRRLTDF
jgi:hypothetical protein